VNTWTPCISHTGRLSLFLLKLGFIFIWKQIVVFRNGHTRTIPLLLCDEIYELPKRIMNIHIQKIKVKISILFFKYKNLDIIILWKFDCPSSNPMFTVHYTYEIWSLFCLFVSLPLHVHSKSCPPLSDPFLKLDPRLCNLLLRHCICIMYSKHRIGRRAVELSNLLVT
jgi:hypothetical protein